MSIELRFNTHIVCDGCHDRREVEFYFGSSSDTDDAEYDIEDPKAFVLRLIDYPYGWTVVNGNTFCSRSCYNMYTRKSRQNTPKTT